MSDDPLAFGPAPPLKGKTLEVARALRPGQTGLPDGTWWSSSRLSFSRPSPTIVKEGALFKRYPKWYHPSEDRGLSIGELRRIATFPDDFQFTGAWSDMWARIGNSVPPLLARAVAEHIRRNILGDKETPTVVSTFAGCGGSSLGYKLAGYKCRLAIEWDDNAAECYRLNFPQTKLYHGDIAALTDAEALKLSGLEPGELDVFDGSPPCQGFSTAGKRVMDDPRNMLFREYIRLLKAFRPRAFVMENVSGMVKGKMVVIFAEILRELKACGYKVSARLLNAMYFGVPQSRQRMIFIGVREDLGIDPSHPRAQTKPIPLRDVLPVSDGDHPRPPQLTPKYRAMAPLIAPGECAADHDPGKGFQNLVRAKWSRPHPTLTKMNPGNGRGTPLHPEEHRSLSIEEALRIGSFPDDFRLVGPFVERWARIGNSVPPLLMKAVATHVREHVLEARR